MLRALSILFLSGLCLASSPARVAAERMPRSVLLYEQHAAHLPQSHFDLDACTLAQRRGQFYGLPAHRTPSPCDRSRLHIAYGGWCERGFRDARGVHFSQSLMPLIRVVEYEDGIVIYVNNYLKGFETSTEADEQAALDFLERPERTGPYDVRGAALPLFPPGWEPYLPLKPQP